MAMTDQRLGTTPFNCVLVCVVLSPSPHVHRVTVARCKVCVVVILFPIVSRFCCVFVISTSLSFCFLHLPHLLLIISPIGNLLPYLLVLLSS